MPRYVEAKKEMKDGGDEKMPWDFIFLGFRGDSQKIFNMAKQR